MTTATQIAVRQLAASDAAQYLALRLEGLRAFPHAFRSDYEEALSQPVSWAEKRLATQGEYWFGAFDRDRLVGAICLRTQEGKKIRHAATLNALVVDPTRQRAGIGRMLVGHLVAFARSLGYIRQISLTVSDGNTSAERLYDAFGFEQFGLERDAFLYDGQYCAKQHRQLFLRTPDTHE